MLKFTAYFAISFVIMCIPIKGHVLFEHLHARLAPYASSVIKSVGDTAGSGINKGRRFTQKLFDSSPPVSDSVRTKSSAGRKRLDPKQDGYTIEEERMLREVMEKEASE